MGFAMVAVQRLVGAWCGDKSAETLDSWAKEWYGGTNHWLNVCQVRFAPLLVPQSVLLSPASSLTYASKLHRPKAFFSAPWVLTRASAASIRHNE